MALRGESYGLGESQPPEGLTGGVGVQEAAAEAAAAAEVGGGTARFPGATEPRRVTGHQPAGPEVSSGCPTPVTPPVPPPPRC